MENKRGNHSAPCIGNVGRFIRGRGKGFTTLSQDNDDKDRLMAKATTTIGLLVAHGHARKMGKRKWEGGGDNMRCVGSARLFDKLVAAFGSGGCAKAGFIAPCFPPRPRAFKVNHCKSSFTVDQEYFVCLQSKRD